VVSLIPANQLGHASRQFFNGLLPIMALVVIVIAIGSWFLALGIVKHAEAEHEIEHMAHFDTLTELPNRSLLLDRLQQLIIASTRGKETFALMFIDLDGFKAVNDTFGHDMGDAVLQKTAQRLRDSLRKMDTAARIGGDEFVVLVTDQKETATAKIVAEKIIASLNQPFDLMGEHPQIGASIGISIFPSDGDTSDELINNADAAMYLAKTSGKNGYRFYDKNLASPAA